MHDVIVAGAGIGGLTAALTLHRAGCRVRVVEAVANLQALGVGINLLPHCVQELIGLGLRETLEASAIATGSLRYHARDGKTIWAEPRGLDAGYPCPQYSIHRGALQMLLLEAVQRQLGDDAIVTGQALLQVSQHGDAVVAEFGEARTGAVNQRITADCLIGADGIMSTVRAAFYPDEGNPVYAGQVMWRGVTVREPYADGRTMVMVGSNRQKAVAYPIGWADETHQIINWIAELTLDTQLPANKGDWNKPGDKADFVEQFRDWNFDWLDFPDLFERADGCWQFPMVDRDPVDRWSFGRVSLLGDAAHAMRPNGSNGASQAVLDAVALADALAAEADVEAALRNYEAARLEPTAALTLANRASGPEVVLQMVEDRCPDGFDDIYDHFSAAELAEIADSYKQIAGFSRDQVRGRVR